MMQETEPVPETNEPEVDVVEPISVPDEKPMQELTEEEREKLMKRKAEKELEYTATMQKWGKVALYAMFFPTFLSIITIIAGVWVLNVSPTTCVVNLKAHVAGNVVMSYFLLIFYAYVLIGPWPITDLRVYWVFGGIWTFITGILGLVGTGMLGSASPCAATSPALLSMSKYLVAIFWIGAIVSGWYVGEELLRIYRKKQAEKQAKLRADMAAAEAEADARGEDKNSETGNGEGEPLSPGAQSAEGKDGDNDDDGEDDDVDDDEDDADDGPRKRK